MTDEGPKVDAERVVRRLAEQIAQLTVQVAQYEALVAQLVEEAAALRAARES